MKMKLIETNNIGGTSIIDRSKSIFNAIKGVRDNPFTWLNQANADLLDIEYYLNHSGEKLVSPMVQRLVASTGTDMCHMVAKIIIEKFNDKWNKLYKAFIDSDYEPLENYNMVQKETPNITHASTEKQKTKIETETTNDKTQNDVYGFNSVNPVASGEQTRNALLTVKGNENDNETSKTETETGTRDLTRHGNIGVTTSQQMLQSEIDLRKNYNFVEMLYADVDSVMTLLVY